MKSIFFLLLTCIFFSSAAQVKTVGTDDDTTSLIVITTRYQDADNPLRTGKSMEYIYKGERKEIGYWAKNYMEVVKPNVFAVKEVNKYRTKMVSSTILGSVSLGFFIGTILSVINDDTSLNWSYLGIGTGCGIAMKIVQSTTQNNIKKAGEYFVNDKQASLMDFNSNVANYSYFGPRATGITIKFKF